MKENTSFVTTFFVCLFLTGFFSSQLSAQSCLNPGTFPHKKLPSNTVIWYSFDSSIPSNHAARTQIQSAISTISGASGICFNNTWLQGFEDVPGDGNVVFKFGNLGGEAAAYANETQVTGNIIEIGTITFDVNLNDGDGNYYYDADEPGYSTIFQKMALHEMGHLLGISHYTSGYPNPCTQQITASMMNDGCGVNDNGISPYPGRISTTITACDSPRLQAKYPCPTPTPTPSPSPTPLCLDMDNDFYTACYANCGASNCGGDCDDSANGWNIYPGAGFSDCSSFWDSDCDGLTNEEECILCECSPIIVDVDGNGITLTNAANGVDFDINGDGGMDRVGWKSIGCDDAWLVFDRNGNGLIDDGKELFGDSTTQPVPPLGVGRNGFLALAEYDKIENGGNADGFITRKDLIFDDLRLWKDVNHNGISESTELSTLPQLGLRKLHLDYRDSNRVDEHGNRFKYKAKVKDAQDAQMGRWAWDVFLVKQNP